SARPPQPSACPRGVPSLAVPFRVPQPQPEAARPPRRARWLSRPLPCPADLRVGSELRASAMTAWSTDFMARDGHLFRRSVGEIVAALLKARFPRDTAKHIERRYDV